MGKEQETRVERDSMGEVTLPAQAWWGAQTQRAVENFGTEPFPMPQEFIRALALVKRSAALANKELGGLDAKLAEAVVAAADQVILGEHHNQFPVNVFQTGSATSSNMNMNEVLANLANVSLGSDRGTRSPVHPNDQVNRGQSSNDVIPTALHIANRLAAEDLVRDLKVLETALDRKAQEFASVLKLGRTHLQDAVPMTLGQEFSAFREQIKKSQERIKTTFGRLEELALGGTAIGSGLNCPPGFPEKAIGFIADYTKIPFQGAVNRFEAIANRDAQVELMGALNTTAGSLMKIANDLRLLSSGPRGGLGEIELPALQPGSSIMPGKVNPVIPEMVIQIAAFVQGQALSVTLGGQNGPLQLNMMHPLIAWSSLRSLSVLSHGALTLAKNCVQGITAKTEYAQGHIEKSLALVTPLAIRLGYDKAAELAHEAYVSGKTIREVVKASGLLADSEVEQLLDPRQMING